MLVKMLAWFLAGMPMPTEVPEHLVIRPWEGKRFAEAAVVADGFASQAGFQRRYEWGIRDSNSPARFQQWEREVDKAEQAWLLVSYALDPTPQWCPVCGPDGEEIPLPPPDDPVWDMHRIGALTQLRDLIGHQAYYTGQMPPIPNLRVTSEK